MKHILSSLLCAALVLSGCAGVRFVPGTATSFPKANQKGKTAIVAHRGFWNCEAAGYMENTIASLKAAQDNGLWGSEFDIHITSDDVVLVNHNDNIQGVKIADNPLSVFKAMTNEVLKPKSTKAIVIPLLYLVIGKKKLYPIIARREYDAVKKYEPVAARFTEVESVKNDEQRHGDTVLGLL